MISGLQSSGTRDIPAAARGEGHLSLARGRMGNCWLADEGQCSTDSTE